MTRIVLPFFVFFPLLFSCEKYPHQPPAINYVTIDTLTAVTAWDVYAVQSVIKRWDPTGMPVDSRQYVTPLFHQQISFFRDGSFNCDTGLANELHIPISGRFTVSEGEIALLDIIPGNKMFLRKVNYSSPNVYLWARYIDTIANAYYEIDCRLNRQP